MKPGGIYVILSMVVVLGSCLVTNNAGKMTDTVSYHQKGKYGDFNLFALEPVRDAKRIPSKKYIEVVYDSTNKIIALAARHKSFYKWWYVSRHNQDMVLTSSKETNGILENDSITIDRTSICIFRESIVAGRQISSQKICLTLLSDTTVLYQLFTDSQTVCKRTFTYNYTASTIYIEGHPLFWLFFDYFSFFYDVLKCQESTP
jgi:hypothetical protein